MGVVSLMAWAGSAWGAINFTGPTSYTPRADCIYGDGGYTEVTAFSWTSGADLQNTPAGQALWASVQTQTASEFPIQWGYSLSNALTGNLNVDNYDAFDKDAGSICKHGVTMKATLNGVTNLPANTSLNWYQVYRENGDSISRGHAANDWTIDPAQRETVGGVTEDDAPFYYNQAEEGLLHPDANTWKFSDSPSDKFADPTVHAGSIEFFTMLASWDGNYEPTEGGVGSHEITVYGGWSWGYSYYCPEPSSMMLVVVVVGAALRRTR